MLDTVVFSDLDKNYDELISKAASSLKGGSLVIFPTETVYGIGANYKISSSVKKIFEVKGRPLDNPLILHVSSIDMAMELIDKTIDTKLFESLANKFWPGPITFIMKKSSAVSDFITCGLNTVAIRMPSNTIANKLISLAGTAIPAPSANISGLPSSTRKEHVIDDFYGKVEYIISSDDKPIGIESTVLDLSLDKPIILRPGAVTKEQIEEFLGYEISYFKYNGLKKPKSPGMKYKHYSPKASVIVLEYDYIYSDKSKLKKDIGVKSNNIMYLEYKNSKLMAENLFADFRLADKNNYDYIAVKPCRKDEIGVAVLNRLSKASGNSFEL